MFYRENQFLYKNTIEIIIGAIENDRHKAFIYYSGTFLCIKS